MKKSLLFGFVVCLGYQAIAQNQQLPSIPGPVSNKSVKYDKTMFVGGEIAPLSSVYTPAPLNNRMPYTTTPTPLTSTTIGTTGYQLQTNRSVRNGLVMNTDNTLSAGFIFSTALSAWPDRGTGYNYNNGSGWGAQPTVRIETVRTGWGEIAVTADDAEHVIGHAPPTIVYNHRPTKGTGNWIETTIPSTITQGNLWPRMSSGGPNGLTLHAISITAPVANAGAMYQGQDGALTYARSLDAGVTWSTFAVSTLHDSAAGYSGMGGDSYAIDSKGNNVAYVFGDYNTSWTLMKSTDNGTTWTKTTIKSFPIPYYNTQLTDTNGDQVGDTLWASDGSLDVVIDNSGMAHCFSGRMRVLCTDTAVGLSYFPVTDGMWYWNEGMGSAPPVVITGAEDIDQSGTLDLPTPQTSGDFPFGIYLTSMASHPSASVNTTTGELWLLYDAVIEGSDNGSGYAYRNVYGMKSADGGATWSTPVRYFPDLFGEQVYPTSAPHFTGTCLPFYYQNDASVGHGFNNQPSGSPDPQSGPAEILYDCFTIVGVNEIDNNVFTLGDAYPNPTNGATDFSLTVKKSGNVTVELFNTVGSKVATIINKNMIAGEHTFSFDASKLSAGVYYYTVNAGGFRVTKKLVVM
jgi:hypothetical protein